MKHNEDSMEMTRIITSSVSFSIIKSKRKMLMLLEISNKISNSKRKMCSSVQDLGNSSHLTNQEKDRSPKSKFSIGNDSV